MQLMLLQAVLAAILGPFTASSNFAADLLGPVDTRVGCWGRAEAVTWAVTFKAPAGHRVRILRIRGDLVAWPKFLTGELPMHAGRYAGVLVGFQSTAPEGSTRCDWCADATWIYYQGALDSTSTRPLRIHWDDSVDELLEPDHKLVVKVASWLNTIEKPIHIEPTFTVRYQFERQGE